MHVQFVIDMLKVFLASYVLGSSGVTVASAVRQTLRDFVYGPGPQVLRERYLSSCSDEDVSSGNSRLFQHKDFCQSMCGNCIHVRDFWTILKGIVPETFSSNKGESFLIAASQKCATLAQSDRESTAAFDDFWLNSSAAQPISNETTSCLQELNKGFDLAIQNDESFSKFIKLKASETKDILAQASMSVNAAYSSADIPLSSAGHNAPVDFSLPPPHPLECLRPVTPPAQVSSDDEDEEDEEDDENETSASDDDIAAVYGQIIPSTSTCDVSNKLETILADLPLTPLIQDFCSPPATDSGFDIPPTVATVTAAPSSLGKNTSPASTTNVSEQWPEAVDNEETNGTSLFRRLLRLSSTVSQAGIHIYFLPLQCPAQPLHIRKFLLLHICFVPL